MNLIEQLQNSAAFSLGRVDPATAATCLISLARWMKAEGVPVERATRYLDAVAPIIEREIVSASGALILFALERRGLRVLPSDDDAELRAFIATAARDGVPFMGLNPAVILRDAASISITGGHDNVRHHTIH